MEPALHRPPGNEIGPVMLAELGQFVVALESLSSEADMLIVYSELKSGFSAGGDLHELYTYTQTVSRAEGAAGIRASLE
jgi:enoyl-CoA hydratase/carnithine racemase